MSINAIRFGQYGLKFGRSNFSQQANVLASKQRAAVQAAQAKASPNQVANAARANLNSASIVKPAVATNSLPPVSNVQKTDTSVSTQTPFTSSGLLSPQPGLRLQPVVITNERVGTVLPPAVLDESPVTPPLTPVAVDVTQPEKRRVGIALPPAVLDESPVSPETINSDQYGNNKRVGSPLPPVIVGQGWQPLDTPFKRSTQPSETGPIVDNSPVLGISELFNDDVVDRVGDRAPVLPQQAVSINIREFVSGNKGYVMLPGGIYMTKGYSAPVDVKA